MAALRLVVSNAEPLAEGSPYRPPGALPEQAFQDTCTGCGDCADICPVNSIVLDAQRYPFIHDHHACNTCGLCADVCMTGAISFTTETLRGLQMILAVDRQPLVT